MDAQIERRLIEKYAAIMVGIADTAKDRKELFERAKEARLDLEAECARAGLTRDDARTVWTTAAMSIPE